MGSFQTLSGMRSSALLETSCGYLLQELQARNSFPRSCFALTDSDIADHLSYGMLKQMIWDEVGESRFEREKVLLQLEQECLEAYRRKVDCANISRTRLHQELAEAEAEFTHLLLSLGEQSLPGRPEKMVGTLKQQLDSITPALREMRLRKDDRVNKFRALQGQIQKISAEIAGQSEYDGSITNTTVNEKDLSLKKLEEYQNELQTLQNDKNNRLRKVEKYIDAIIAVAATLGMESSMIITKVHPSLNELCGICKNISDGILIKLDSTVESLEKEKQKRLDKLQHLGKALTNLWNLIETPYKERRQFYQIVNLLTVSSAELSDSGSLTLDIIQQAEAEVRRLDKLKAAKINELFLKKQKELEDICSKSHMKVPSNLDIEKIINLVNYGGIGHADLLVSMDEQISKAKEEASSRKPIMEKMDKWIMARDEERWLEEYSRDDNKYTVSRGAHKNLKRAERARVTVNKIPALVDSLVTQTKSWEEERKRVFLYDEVPLLAMLEEYNMLRKKREDEKQRQREDEKQRQRERKKVESQLASRQENIFGSRPPSSHRHLPDRSLNGGYSNPRPLNRELSLAIQVQHLESNSINSAAQAISHIKGRSNKVQGERTLCAPNLNFHRRDENVSVVSMYSGPLSP